MKETRVNWKVLINVIAVPLKTTEAVVKYVHLKESKEFSHKSPS